MDMDKDILDRLDDEEELPPEPLRVTIVDKEENVGRAVRQLLKLTEDDLKVYGLDCEWDLVTTKGAVHKPDILQIATVQGYCTLFRLHMMGKVPSDLRGFLEDPYFIKVGVGIVEDRDKLRNCYDVRSEGVVDVRHLADDLEVPPRGLKHLVKSVLGVDIAKHHYSFHQWTGYLSRKQRTYAALDAIYSARIFYKLSHDRISDVYDDGWQDWSHREYHERTLAMWDCYCGKPFDFGRSKYYKKKILEYLLSFADLTPELRPEPDDELEDLAEELVNPEELEAFPTFNARFSKKKKKKIVGRIPKRYLRKHIRRLEERGIDPRTIPREVLPKMVLDEEGKLDLEKAYKKVDLAPVYRRWREENEARYRALKQKQRGEDEEDD